MAWLASSANTKNESSFTTYENGDAMEISWVPHLPLLLLGRITVIGKGNLKMVKINIEKGLRRLLLGVEERMKSSNDSERKGKLCRGEGGSTGVCDGYKFYIAGLYGFRC